MNVRGRIFGAVLGVLAIGAILSPLSALRAADETWLWGASGARTTYSPPYDPSDAPPIPLLKRPETASAVGTENGGGKKSGVSSVGPRVGDSGTFVGSDGKTYYYRFVEGVRRRAVVETRLDAASPSGWRKTLRYVDEPRLIKQIWPMETTSATPEPCRPVENVVETDGKASADVAPAPYRATARAIVP